MFFRLYELPITAIQFFLPRKGTKREMQPKKFKYLLFVLKWGGICATWDRIKSLFRLQSFCSWQPIRLALLWKYTIFGCLALVLLPVTAMAQFDVIATGGTVNSVLPSGVGISLTGGTIIVDPANPFPPPNLLSNGELWYFYISVPS